MPRDNFQPSRARLAVEKAIKHNPDDEPAQFEAISEYRGCFKGCGRAVDIVKSYTDGMIDVQETVRRIAEPIEHAYTSADGGRLFVAEEPSARIQRTYLNPEEALERWGPEEELDELQARVTDPEDASTTEDELWDLYYTILHAAKKTPWRDEDAQQRLVDLLAGLMARPDPDFPPNMTAALKRNWIYAGGRLWSDAILLGASLSETWNDIPGCGSGWYPPEVNAWVNINAFAARVTAQGSHNLRRFPILDLSLALHREIDIEPSSWFPAPSRLYKAEFLFDVAAVWIRLAGQSIFEALSGSTEDDEDTDIRFWEESQRRFEDEVARTQYSSKTTALAEECAEIMSRISAEAEK